MAYSIKGAYYHLLSCANERRDILRDNDDRVLFLKTLGNMSDRFEVEVYAYVLMDNPYHLLHEKIFVTALFWVLRSLLTV
ncbi:hypothetical protein KsCSTR_26190 [Candidatus Kuenenia stuttgartiensis]|uniref:Transposase IS200-like domain-containing protein n=1 Tax=Kuenenia stuttgartiensis TaxID=174633 RepID=Q1Q763_KUEST|nr:transposase [Planctomycetia bacterium]MBW7942329.1 transposase [Candidatus Kuenenia stuttgartiensis]MBZ0190734.1 transposase [Candidatus Kuenenia stuttgartiensis]MCF6151560.1 hypothetical protein [Candidatus Kuenenia stuttgartiensis]MCL4727307.1 transposase [Candidatus Kuenenia stuttgartiensis]